MQHAAKRHANHKVREVLPFVRLFVTEDAASPQGNTHSIMQAGRQEGRQAGSRARTDLGGTPQAAGIAAVALPRASDALVIGEELRVVSDHTA